jgi:Leucine-rich repeat (LRR) protein
MADSPPDYSLKRLRDLCAHIHEENTAFLLKTSLPEFPVEIVDKFFTSPKLNKPSGPDDREWTDIVRLAFIAFAPEGSEPARLRGKPIPRYVRSYPFEPNRPDLDEPGSLRLYPVEHASPLLKDISAALGVNTLRIESPLWLSRYLCDPFPLRALNVGFRVDGGKWHPLPGLASDYREALEVLPAELEFLDIGIEPRLPLSGAEIKRFTSLKKLHLTVESLPDGMDFSNNAVLEDLQLEVRLQGTAPIKGLGRLPSLQCLSITCNTPYRYDSEGDARFLAATTPLESLEGLFARGVSKIRLDGVRCSAESMEGRPPLELSLTNVSGLKNVSFGQAASKGASVSINSSSLVALQIAHACDLRVRECPGLESVTARLAPGELNIADCPVLRSIAISLEACAPSKIEFKHLPVLQDFKLDAAGVDMALDYDGGPKFKIIGCGISRLPDFGGKWEGLKAIDLVGNRALQNLSGIEALRDLEILNVRSVMEKPGFGAIKPYPKVKHDSLVAIFSGDTIPPMPSVASLIIEDAPLGSLRGLDAFPNLTSIVIRSGSIESLDGIGELILLQKADLTDCGNIRSLAPLAGLGNLVYLKLSGCGRIKPKPPHTVMEGPELLAELARHAAPGQPVAKSAPSRELAKLVELIGEGVRSDVRQALQLLQALPSGESEKLLGQAALDPETGWIRLPYLVRIDEEKVRGIAQLRIVQAVGGESAAALLGSVKSVAINNDSGRNSLSTLRMGKKTDHGRDDDILDEFPSLGSLPDFPNLEELSIHRLSRFSLEGAEKFPTVRTLRIENVSQIESLTSLGCLSALEELSLCGPDARDLTGLGAFPALKHLTIRYDLSSLDGLENFPSLETLQIRSTGDVSALFDCASQRGCRVAFKGSAGEGDMFWSVRFELQKI